jgi:hypothetical protein
MWRPLRACWAPAASPRRWRPLARSHPPLPSRSPLHRNSGRATAARRASFDRIRQPHAHIRALIDCARACAAVFSYSLPFAPCASPRSRPLAISLYLRRAFCVVERPCAHQIYQGHDGEIATGSERRQPLGEGPTARLAPASGTHSRAHCHDRPDACDRPARTQKSIECINRTLIWMPSAC